MENNIIQLSHSVLSSDSLSNAIDKRISGIERNVRQDSDGNDYQTLSIYATDIFTVDGERKSYEIKDASLATRLENIKVAIAAGDVSQFILCKELSRLTSDDSDSLGFDSVDKMVESLYGFARSTTANYIRIARFFINDDYTLIDGIPSDTPLGTLNLLLSSVKCDKEIGTIDTSNVLALFKSEIITPYMKQTVVKSRLNALKTVQKSLGDNVKELSEYNDNELSNLLQLVKDTIRNKGKKTKVIENSDNTTSTTDSNTTSTTDSNTTSTTTDNTTSTTDNTLQGNVATSLEYLNTILSYFPDMENDIFTLIETIKHKLD